MFHQRHKTDHTPPMRVYGVQRVQNKFPQSQNLNFPLGDHNVTLRGNCILNTFNITRSMTVGCVTARRQTTVWRNTSISCAHLC